MVMGFVFLCFSSFFSPTIGDLAAASPRILRVASCTSTSGGGSYCQCLTAPVFRHLYFWDLGLVGTAVLRGSTRCPCCQPVLILSQCPDWLPVSTTCSRGNRQDLSDIVAPLHLATTALAHFSSRLGTATMSRLREHLTNFHCQRPLDIFWTSDLPDELFPGLFTRTLEPLDPALWIFGPWT
ncbi:hypothetical protein VTJ04DRAFT_2336 [Mycothermus thermophilus]|uniref:uncharacterized protein n=1 Tax=Humicola insolens TaxID=85995 RepID=UPI003741F4FF